VTDTNSEQPRLRAVLRHPDAHPRPASQPRPRLPEHPWPAPARPPASWFTATDQWPSPGQRLTVENNGQVFGSLCTRTPFVPGGWEREWVAPRSPSRYAIAHQGSVECDDGTVVRGAVIGAILHSEDGAPGWHRHYTHPDRAVALVRFYDRPAGIVFCGSLVPNLSYGDVLELRRCSVSGHWEHVSAARLAGLGVDHPGGFDLIGAALTSVPAAPLVGTAPVVVSDPVAPRGDQDEVDRLRARCAALEARLADERDRRHDLADDLVAGLDRVGRRMHSARVTRFGAAGPAHGAGVAEGLAAAAVVFAEVERPHLDLVAALLLDEPLPIP
jgi:hypothetical protein